MPRRARGRMDYLHLDITTAKILRCDRKGVGIITRSCREIFSCNSDVIPSACGVIPYLCFDLMSWISFVITNKDYLMVRPRNIIPCEIELHCITCDDFVDDEIATIIIINIRQLPRSVITVCYIVRDWIDITYRT